MSYRLLTLALASIALTACDRAEPPAAPAEPVAAETAPAEPGAAMNDGKKTLWRPAPRGQQARKRPSGKKPANSAAHKNSGAAKSAKKTRRGKAEKPLDPSSPFAVLQQLNKGVENADEA